MNPHSLDASLQSSIDSLTQLIAFPSISSTSNVAVNQWCANQLESLGFNVTLSGYQDGNGTAKANLVAVRRPLVDRSTQNNGAGLAYFCHTDVVPAEKWQGPYLDEQNQADPFRARVVDQRLYGRGACDMKGSLASMLSAVARTEHADQANPLWIVCTADEEVGFGGAKHLSKHCPAYRELADAGPLSIIGEPTELKVVHAHKGIRGFRIRSVGRAGHSATHYGINANEAMVPMLAKLLEICQRTRTETQYQDDRFDPPLLSWNFGVSDHSHVINITPERSDAWCSLRTMPEVDGQVLIDEVATLADELGLSMKWINGCDPLWMDPQHPDIQMLETITQSSAHSVCYATDGGVLSDLSKRVVLGPGSIQQAHTIDEWISLEQLARGIECYEQAIRHWCC